MRAPDATPAERWAADELQAHLERATGRRLPVVDAPAAVASGRFLVGPRPGDPPRAPEEQWIRIAPGEVRLSGGRPRGTLYAVYAFLEEHLGVRFLTADHTHVPRLVGPRPLAAGERASRPRFSFRWPFAGEVNADPVFAARLRVNAVSDDPRVGGRDPHGLVSHSFLHLLPSRLHGREHPEWYALREGKRLAPFEHDGTTTQPCLTHPEVRRRITEQLLRALELHPELKTLSVSQNDNALHCQCPACRALDEREGTPMGSLLTLVNAVADEVGKRRPDVKVGTLAYWYTRKPPRSLRPRDNVQIQLCSIECCLVHPLDDPACPRNAEFCRDLQAWSEVARDVRVWSYNANFSDYLLPCPSLGALGPNLRFLAARGVQGVFLQAAGDARGAELSELRAWVSARLLWDPARDGDALVREFVQLHYAEAAAPVLRFVLLAQGRAAARGLHPNCFGRAADYGLDTELGLAGLLAFEEALGLARSDAVRARVEKASIPALRLALEPAWEAEAPLPPEQAARLRPLARRLFELCARHGVTHARERVPLEQARERVQRALGGW